MLYTVEVRLGEGSLVDRMSEMRVWLDSHRYEPDLFQYRKETGGALIRVEFKIEKEAFEFAEAFGGSVLRCSRPPYLGNAST
jgi:hypothetical protein